jgi:hypothetical protein
MEGKAAGRPPGSEREREVRGREGKAGERARSSVREKEG